MLKQHEPELKAQTKVKQTRHPRIDIATWQPESIVIENQMNSKSDDDDQSATTTSEVHIHYDKLSYILLEQEAKGSREEIDTEEES